MDPLWFVPEQARSMIQPGDEIKVVGFRQFKIMREGEQVFHGNIPNDAKLVVE